MLLPHQNRKFCSFLLTFNLNYIIIFDTGFWILDISKSIPHLFGLHGKSLYLRITRQDVYFFSILRSSTF